jgi:hypothetical protein
VIIDPNMVSVNEHGAVAIESTNLAKFVSSSSGIRPSLAPPNQACANDHCSGNNVGCGNNGCT